MVDIDCNDSIKHITQNLYLALIKLKANRAKWYSKLCRDLKLPASDQKRRKMNKMLDNKYPHFSDKRWSFGENGQQGFKVSFTKIAEWLGCSVGKAHSLIQELLVRQMIKVKSSYRLYKPSLGAKALLNANPKFFVSRQGNICLVACNEYDF